jgi:alpha-tubulin suppressor-like RCC1 family protein
VTAIAATSYYTCAIQNGAVKCWGENSNRELGDGTNIASNVPVQVYDMTSGATLIEAAYERACAFINNEMKCWGSSAGSASVKPGFTGNVTDIAVGNMHECAIIDNEAYCSGFNLSGECGTGGGPFEATAAKVVNLSTNVTEIEAGYSTTCVIDDGSVKCWGVGTSGETGDGSGANTPTAVPATGLDTGVTALSATSFYNFCAIKNSKNYCWGSNSGYQFYDPTDPGNLLVPTANDSDRNLTHVFAEDKFLCFLENKTLFCRGSNSSNQLGNSNAPGLNETPGKSTLGLTDITSITTARGVTCAISGGKAYCWGDNSGSNSEGVLGDGSTTDSSTPVPVNILTSGVTSISAGGHSCAIAAGAAYCWGENGVGQIGDGTATDPVTEPSPVTGLGSGVTHITAAWLVSYAVVNGAVKSWGSDNSGRLGNDEGNSGNQNTPQDVYGLSSGVTELSPEAAFGNCAAIDKDLYCWGADEVNGEGPGDRFVPEKIWTATSAIEKISTVFSHACVVVSGELYCFGESGSGQLGNGQKAYAPGESPTFLVDAWQ